MTAPAPPDPNSHTDLCMRCGAYDRSRNLSLIANDLRLWLCGDCQQVFLALVKGWLTPPVRLSLMPTPPAAPSDELSSDTLMPELLPRNPHA